jgi:hypothetical protein
LSLGRSDIHILVVFPEIMGAARPGTLEALKTRNTTHVPLRGSLFRSQELVELKESPRWMAVSLSGRIAGEEATGRFSSASEIPNRVLGAIVVSRTGSGA